MLKTFITVVTQTEHDRHDPLHCPTDLGFCQSFGNHRVCSLERSCENRYDLGTVEWCRDGIQAVGRCLCTEIWNPSDTTVGQHLTKCWLTGSDGLEQTPKVTHRICQDWEHIEIEMRCVRCVYAILCRASKTGHGGRYLAIIRAVCPVSVKAMISLPRLVDGWW